MQRTIIGFHRDEAGDFVAELECGHGRHVRHDPPLVERPWVLSEAGRRGRLGQTLDCVRCDRGEPAEGSASAGGESVDSPTRGDAASADPVVRGDAASADPVVIAPYDPAWPRRFEAERRNLLEVLAPLRPRIEHVGSTAVPGLAAKPIIDVLLGVDALETFEPCIARLEAAGWRHHPEHEREIPERRFLARPPEPPRAAHLHAVATSSTFFSEHLRFRDRLRADPRLAREYEAMKHRLAERHRHDRDAYARAKTGFVRAALDTER